MARDTRHRMVASAVQLFRRHGYNGTGLREVLADSNAPRGSIYHHFPEGKAQLGIEAIIQAGEFVNQAAVRENQGDDVVEGTRRFIDWWTDYVESTGFEAGCPVVAVAAEFHPEAPGLTEAAASVFDVWQKGLAIRLRHGGIQRQEAYELATLSIAAIEGATVMCRVTRDRGPLDRVAKQLVNAVRNALPA